MKETPVRVFKNDKNEVRFCRACKQEVVKPTHFIFGARELWGCDACMDSLFLGLLRVLQNEIICAYEEGDDK